MADKIEEQAQHVERAREQFEQLAESGVPHVTKTVMEANLAQAAVGYEALDQEWEHSAEEMQEMVESRFANAVEALRESDAVGRAHIQARSGGRLPVEAWADVRGNGGEVLPSAIPENAFNNGAMTVGGKPVIGDATARLAQQGQQGSDKGNSR